MSQESTMRIRHLSFSDLDGGAARAAYRLHTGMVQAGVDSHFLVRHKLSDDKTVIPLHTGIVSRFLSYHRAAIDRLPVRALYPRLQAPWFFPNWTFDLISRHPDVQAGQIVQLHWVSGGFLRPESLRTMQKPIVWRLSDFWPFSGGCHYPWDCRRFEESCGTCPQLGSLNERDLSTWVFNRKKAAYDHLDLTIVAPSTWIAEHARRSQLFRSHPVHVIHNGIDLDMFRPIPRSVAVEALGLDPTRKYVLFGAIHGTTDERKGFAFLFKALQQMKARFPEDFIELLVFGSSRPADNRALPFPTRFLGVLKDDLSLKLAYNAADVFVAPSLEENFSSTVLEAVACGRPVVAFDTGGMPDLIEHQVNGILAPIRDSVALAEGITSILSFPQRAEELGAQARRRAEREFSLQGQTAKYVRLYESLLDRRPDESIEARSV